MMPARKTPSKVPAPPMETTGAPVRRTLARLAGLARSAPASVQSVLATYASPAMAAGCSRRAVATANKPGSSAGTAIPSPGTGCYARHEPRTGTVPRPGQQGPDQASRPPDSTGTQPAARRPATHDGQAE